MEKLLRIFGKEYINVNQAALLLGSFAFLSQILGLFRDRALAHFIGPTLELDIYYAAFRVPDLIFISVASLASITVIIPFLADKIKGDVINDTARKLLNDIFTVFFSFIVLVSVIAYFAMPDLVWFIAPGFDLESQTQVVRLSQIMLLSPILLGLSNLFGTITQLFRRFFLYSLSPISYNFGIILGVLFLYPVFGISGLALGVILGAFFHFLIQFLSSRVYGFKTTFSFSIDFVTIKKVVLISLPRTLGLSLNNIAQIFIISIASFMHAGSISIFNLSFNLQAVPLSIIGISYSVAAFPTLTRFVSEGKSGEFKEHLKSAARSIVFWSIPATFLFIVLRAQVVRVILGSGSFSWENTRLVAASLAIFSVSILAQGMIALLSRAYYARGETKKPLVVNFICSILIVVFAFLFTYLFSAFPYFRYFIESLLKVSDIPGTEVLMLPLAYSLGTVINFIFHWYNARKDFMQGESLITKTFFQSLGASFFLGIVSYAGLNVLSGVFGTTTLLGVFLQGLISGILGILAGAMVLYLLKSEELFAVLEALKTKFWKSKVVVPSEDKL